MSHLSFRRLSLPIEALILLSTGMEDNPDSMLMYTECNRKIEVFCKWAYRVGVYAAVGGGNGFLMLMCYVNYFIVDLGDESFVLTSPMA